VTYVGSRVGSLPPMILAVLARKLIIGGGQAFLAFVVAPEKEENDLQDIPVVRESRCLLNRLFWVTITEGCGVWD
jgi:hypothetical protein